LGEFKEFCTVSSHIIFLTLICSMVGLL
jgi:hypothetical protein